MINTFRIYSHDPVSFPSTAGTPLVLTNQPSFLTDENNFDVHNRVTTASVAGFTGQSQFKFGGNVPYGILSANIIKGGGGSENILWQDGMVDVNFWLPPYQISQWYDVYTLNKQSRIAIAYNWSADGTIQPIGANLVQTAFLGHWQKTNEPADLNLIMERPYMYPTNVFNITGGIGSTFTEEITIQGDMGFLCRAFMFQLWAACSINITDLATGYSYMNVPIIARNFCYDFNRNGLASLATGINHGTNFGKGFAPFIIPPRHTIRVTVTLLEDLSEFGTIPSPFVFWGNNCTYNGM